MVRFRSSRDRFSSVLQESKPPENTFSLHLKLSTLVVICILGVLVGVVAFVLGVCVLRSPIKIRAQISMLFLEVMVFIGLLSYL